MPSPFHFNLAAAANASTLENGFAPDFPSEAARQLVLVRGGKGLDFGDRATVKLVSTNPEHGFIDFAV